MGYPNDKGSSGKGGDKGYGKPSGPQYGGPQLGDGSMGMSGFGGKGDFKGDGSMGMSGFGGNGGFKGDGKPPLRLGELASANLAKGEKRPGPQVDLGDAERFDKKGKGKGGDMFFGSMMDSGGAPPGPPAAPQGPPVPIFIAPATAGITPMSTRSSLPPPPPPPGPPGMPMGMPPMPPLAPPGGAPQANKQIAMTFVNADRETQTQMLRDPNVARAIMQTLAESPSANLAQLGMDPAMLSMLGGGIRPPIPPPGMPMPPLGMPGMPPVPPGSAGPGGTLWSGSVTLARNMGKRLTTQAALVYGKVPSVEVLLRAVASAQGVLNISHRVPFDEVARRSPPNATQETYGILSMVPVHPGEQASYDEYVTYFRQKVRSGVAKLDDACSLYIVPPGEDVPALKNSLYPLSDAIPKNTLLGVITGATQQVNVPKEEKKKDGKEGKAAPDTSSAQEAAEDKPSEAAKSEADKPAAEGKEEETKAAGSGGGSADETNMSSRELLDLFSNPELIKLLSTSGGKPES